jgi:hypothetical protein
VAGRVLVGVKLSADALTLGSMEKLGDIERIDE